MDDYFCGLIISCFSRQAASASTATNGSADAAAASGSGGPGAPAYAAGNVGGGSERSNSAGGLSQRIDLTSFQARTLPGGAVERIEVPVYVMDTEPDTARAFEDNIAQLPAIVVQEEEALYAQSFKSAADTRDLLTTLQNGIRYSGALCEVIDRLCVPLVSVLQQRLARDRARVAALRQRLRHSDAGPTTAPS